MTTTADLVATLRDLLDDGADEKVPYLIKVSFLNRGLAAMFPAIYRPVVDASLALAEDTFEYAVPAGVSGAKVVGLYVEQNGAGTRYVPLGGYYLVPGSPAQLILTTPYLPAPVGSHVRFLAAGRLTPLVGEADAYTGPDGTEGLPVLYAMGLVAARRVDPRLDYKRWSSTQNGIDETVLMSASRYWFDQFEAELARAEMALPVAP